MNEYLYFNTLASSTEVDFHERRVWIGKKKILQKLQKLQ